MMSQFKRDNSPNKQRSSSRGLSQRGVVGPSAVKNNMAPRPTLASEISSNTVHNLPGYMPRHNFRNENSNKKHYNPDINSNVST
jgi:hypothetical protein